MFISGTFIKYLVTLSLITVMCLQSCEKESNGTKGTQISEWNEDTHNAFTDLIKFEGYYYCVFRIASDHNSFDGRTRIIRSADGISWNAFSLLSISNRDLRDAHFFIDDNNMLSVSINIRNIYNQRQTVIYKLQNNDFIRSSAHVDNDYMYWAFSKLGNKVYSIGYNVLQNCFSTLNSTKPKLMLFNNQNPACDSFERINVSSSWFFNSFHCPCETSMYIAEDSTMYLIVRDEHTPGQSDFGVSRYPYKTWKWQKFPYFIRGPKLTMLPDGKLFLAAGSMSDYYKTYYAIINPKDFSVEKIKAFPSGGDCGYPGVIIEGNTALVSYYSSHEGNARVYIYRLTY